MPTSTVTNRTEVFVDPGNRIAVAFEEEAGVLRALPPEKQTRLDTLMTRNNAGSLTDQERVELQTLVREAEDITLANARLLAQQRQRLEPVSGGADRAP